MRSMEKLLIVGGVALAAYFLLFKKKAVAVSAPDQRNSFASLHKLRSLQQQNANAPFDPNQEYDGGGGQF